MLFYNFRLRATSYSVEVLSRVTLVKVDYYYYYYYYY